MQNCCEMSGDPHGNPFQEEGVKVASRVALPRMPSEVPPMMDVPKKEFARRRPRIEGKEWPHPEMYWMMGIQPRARSEEPRRGTQGNTGREHDERG